MRHTITLMSTGTVAAAPQSAHVRRRRSEPHGGWILRHREMLTKTAVSTLVSVSLAVAIASLVVRPAIPSPTAWTQVSVEPHASLWSLADAHPVRGLTTGETVRLIVEENHLESGMIHPGQTIRVPSSAGGDTAVALR